MNEKQQKNMLDYALDIFHRPRNIFVIVTVIFLVPIAIAVVIVLTEIVDRSEKQKSLSLLPQTGSEETGIDRLKEPVRVAIESPSIYPRQAVVGCRQVGIADVNHYVYVVNDSAPGAKTDYVVTSPNLGTIKFTATGRANPVLYVVDIRQENEVNWFAYTTNYNSNIVGSGGTELFLAEKQGLEGRQCDTLDEFYTGLNRVYVSPEGNISKD